MALSHFALPSVVPTRPFPAKVWLATRWPFYVPPILFMHRLVKARPAGWTTQPRRAFPAKVWLVAQQRPTPAGD